MATATTTPSTEALRAEHSTAAREKEQAHARVAALADRCGRLHTLVYGGVDQPSTEVGERIAAEIDLPQARQEWNVARLESIEADRREADAREAVRVANAARVNERRRQIVAKLARLLIAAQPLADELAALQDASPIADSVGWPVLMTSTPSFTSQLDHWLACMRALGLLDE